MEGGNQNEATNQPPNQQISFFKKLNISVEPIFFVVFFCFSLTDAASTNLILMKACTLTFDFPKENCTGKISTDIDKIVQPYVAKIVMGLTLTRAIFPSLLSLYIGSWTDNSKKRKPFMILPIIGLTIDYAIWLIFSYLSVPPTFFLIAVLPFSFTGGFVCLFTSGFCYLSDVTNENNRAFRMSVCSIMITLGILFGYIVSYQMYEYYSNDIVYTIVYGNSICCLIIVLLYTAFLLPESESNIEPQESSVERKSLFSISHIKESISVLLKKRPSNGRLLLIFLIMIIVIDITIFGGESSFRYLSVKAMFSWTAEDYTKFSAVISGAGVITGILGVWLLNKVLGLTEPFIIFIVVIASLTSSILMSFATTTTGFYSAALLDSFVSLLSPMVKSEMSQLVPNHEIGKIFAFTSMIEAITPFIASPAYTSVYDAVVDYKPLYVNLLTSAFWLLALILAILNMSLHYIKNDNYTQLQSSGDNEADTNCISGTENDVDS